MIRRLLLLAAFAVAATASAETLEQTFDRTLDLRPGTRVAIDNTNGSVIVRAWDQPRIHIRAVKHVESRDSDTAKQGLIDTRIEVTPSAGALKIHTVFPRSKDGIFDLIAGTSIDSSVSYEIDVPRSLDLHVETVNGHIEAKGIRGAITLSTTNGRIEVTHCAGALDASTTNGRITAELLELTPGQRVQLETINGRIALALPKTIAANIDAETSHGSINTTLPVLANGSAHHALRGTINGGGRGEVRLRTTNGSIDIRGL